MADDHAQRLHESEGWRRFIPPWWTAGFPLIATVGIAAWRAANAAADRTTTSTFVASLIWPGAAAFAIVALFVWLGWILDID